MRRKMTTSPPRCNLIHMKNPLLVTLLSSVMTIIPALSFAGITTVSTRTETNPKYNATFIEMKKKVVLPSAPASDVSWMTDTRFAYTAPSPAQVENYAVVQWIRGCLFQSEFKHGKVLKTLPYVRTHFGNQIVFQHRTWQIDSDTMDAAATSDINDGRFALLRWNTDPQSFDAETANYYAKAKPPHGSVFATNLPSSAFLTQGTGLKDGTAQNASLEFLTCLFKAGDVPETTTPSGSGLDQSRALWCVKWDHKFVWDFAAGAMSRPSQIDPVCLAHP